MNRCCSGLVGIQQSQSPRWSKQGKSRNQQCFNLLFRHFIYKIDHDCHQFLLVSILLLPPSISERREGGGGLHRWLPSNITFLSNENDRLVHIVRVKMLLLPSCILGPTCTLFSRYIKCGQSLSILVALKLDSS